MKFIVTESQFLNVISKFLKQKNFVLKETNNYVYFLTPKSKKVLNIIYVKDNNYCYITYDLGHAMKLFFDLSNDEILDLVGKWLNKEYGFEVKNINFIFPWEEKVFE